MMPDRPWPPPRHAALPRAGAAEGPGPGKRLNFAAGLEAGGKKAVRGGW